MALNPMTITDPEEGREYTLEFSRKTVKKAEDAGLDITMLDSKPMTLYYLFWWSAFLMHHPYMKQDATDKILDALGGVRAMSTIKNEAGESLVEYLAKLYAEPFNTLVPGEDEGTINPPKMAVKF